MLQHLVNLRRFHKQVLMVATDSLLLPLAFILAFYLQFAFDTQIPMSWYFYFLPLTAVPVFFVIGLYRTVSRSADGKAPAFIVLGATFSSLVIATYIHTSEISIPLSCVVIYWFLSIVFTGFVRWYARHLLLRAHVPNLKKRKKIGIYGAGEAGVQLARALNTSLDLQVVAFFDDNKNLIGTTLLGIKVHGPNSIESFVINKDMKELILALPSASRARQKEIIQTIKPIDISLKTLPAITQIINGQVRIEDVREVGVEDLLGRDPIPPIENLFSKCISGKSVLVTGAGGSIGSELCRQIIKNLPAKLVLFEISEYALYSLERELKSFKVSTEIVPVLGDVKDMSLLESVLSSHEIHTVYHAAAYKHVPLVESNEAIAIQNNIFGTLNTALAAGKKKIETFVLISTDKAVRPTNVMGATKRMAELSVQALSKQPEYSKTHFSIVRFGNVLGSSGSVIPLFKEQIKNGGPITLTHDEVTRFFMTIPEAAQLVIQAGALGTDGDVFVLDMGQPIKIKDLAVRMIQLSNFSVKDKHNPDGDIEIKTVGLRPGEKLYEELLIGNDVTSTVHPRIKRAKEKYYEYSKLKEALDTLNSPDKKLAGSDMRKILQLWGDLSC